MSELALERREGLPDALRVLLNDYPRGTWEEHGNFGEMVRFWLERHMMFRDVLAQMTADTQAYIDKEMEGPQYAPRLSRYGGMLLNELHGK